MTRISPIYGIRVFVRHSLHPQRNVSTTKGLRHVPISIRPGINFQLAEAPTSNRRSTCRMKDQPRSLFNVVILRWRNSNLEEKLERRGIDQSERRDIRIVVLNS